MNASAPAPSIRTRGTLPTWGADALVLIALGLAMFAVAVRLPANRLYVDENAHWPEARSFAHGLWQLDPGISTWPTMNALVGWTVALSGHPDSVFAARLVVVAMAGLAAAGLLALARAFEPAGARMRTAQFFLSPAVLPFCALIYTDLPALCALIWTAVGAVRRRPALLFGAGAMACAMRQNNIVLFVGLVAVYGWLTRSAGDKPRRSDLIATAVIVLAWCAVVHDQGGIACGVATRGDHPGGLRGVPNLWFACFVAGLIYAPYFVWRLFRERWRVPLWLPFGLGLLGFATFRVTHRFNFTDVPYMLHNWILALTFNPNGRVLFVTVALTTALLIARWPFARHPELKWPLLLLAVASLLPFWLIEQRYYLPFYALLWAARRPEKPAAEWAQLLFGAGLAAWMVAHIANGSHFV